MHHSRPADSKTTECPVRRRALAFTTIRLGKNICAFLQDMCLNRIQEVCQSIHSVDAYFNKYIKVYMRMYIPTKRTLCNKNQEEDKVLNGHYLVSSSDGCDGGILHTAIIQYCSKSSIVCNLCGASDKVYKCRLVCCDLVRLAGLLRWWVFRVFKWISVQAKHKFWMLNSLICKKIR